MEHTINENFVPHWPNLAAHREAWAQAKAELGADADVRAIARHAQDLLNRAKLAEQAQDEVLQESAK